MADTDPVAELDARFSSEGATATAWEDARERFARAEIYESKYGSDWRFTVSDGAFAHDGGRALVFEVAPSTAFGFGKGEVYSQTRWRFDRE